MPRNRNSQLSGDDEGPSCLTSRGSRRQCSPSQGRRMSPRGRRRQGSPLDSDDASSTESVTRKRSKKRKREYTEAEEKIRTSGRGFGIFHEMWRPYSLIVLMGLQASNADPSTLPGRDQLYVNCFRTLIKFSPTVRAELAVENCDVANIASLLDTARGDTRRSHASSVKKAIGDWHTFNPSYSKKPFSCWGWDHDECARLLCPPNIEWNEMNREDLRDPVKRTKFNLGADDFPRFLWEGETMDGGDPISGFLCHSILFPALRHFVVSPSSGADSKSNLSTKSGYARQCGVSHVTVESIAYAATMVRYGLSDDKRFSANAGFKYKEMYYAILKFVKMWSEADIRRLLARWDREVFTLTHSDNESDDRGPNPDSLAAQLMRRVEALRAQQQR